MTDRVFACDACGARVIRSTQVSEPTICSRCGQMGHWHELKASDTDRPIWMRNLFARIEGHQGQVIWQ